MIRHRIFKRIVIAVMLVVLILPVTIFAADDQDADDNGMFLENKIALTSEEQAYLSEHPSVVMAADASWCPLEYLNDEQEYAGVIAEITRKLESYTGLQIEYKVMDNYTEALEAVQSGQADVISGLADDEAVAKVYNVVLSDPYLTINSAVVSNKELTNLYIGTEHKKIAVVAGDYVNEEIKNRIANSELIECSSNEECLDKIENKEVDMAIIASYCAEHYLSIPKYSEFHNHLMPDFNWQIAFGVSTNADPILLSILNKGIAKMSQVDLNESVYKGIIDAEYDNDLVVFIYKHPMLVICVVLSIVLVIGLLLFIIFQSKKKEQMRKIQDGTRLKLALERTHLCIWEFDIASRKICQIDNEQEKHGFYELRENIPESVIEKEYIHPEDIGEVQAVLERVVNGEQDVQGCWRVKEKSADAKNTSYWWEQVLFHIVFDEHHKPVSAIGVSEDVTKEKNAQRDSLTSVYNRHSFEEKATVILNERRNSYLQCAFLILDLDGFKQINDTYGHGAGDRVLISVGATLNKTFRSTDIVGRLGGDEFTVFMTSISKKEDAMKKAGELVDNISRISKNEDFPFEISCSVGVAIGVKGKEDLSVMYKKADLALYEAKHAGKNRYKIYDGNVKKKILVVDDIEMSRVILKKTLEAEYDIVEAENGLAALEVLNKNDDISMVITDIVMPEMDGAELIKQMRSDEKYVDIAIIAQTQYGDIKQEKELLTLGVNDFVYKAASPGIIQMRVGNIMKANEL